MIAWGGSDLPCLVYMWMSSSLKITSSPRSALGRPLRAAVRRTVRRAAVDGDEASSIGVRARMIRRRRGLSLEVVAGLAGISPAYLSMLERGQRGFNRRGLLEDLADALG